MSAYLSDITTFDSPFFCSFFRFNFFSLSFFSQIFRVASGIKVKPESEDASGMEFAGKAKIGGTSEARRAVHVHTASGVKHQLIEREESKVTTAYLASTDPGPFRHHRRHHLHDSRHPQHSQHRRRRSERCRSRRHSHPPGPRAKS